MKFTAPKARDYESKPHLEIKRHDGKILRIYKHKTEKGAHRITIDGKPYNPKKNFVQAISKGLINKK
jgi:hypothetical protein